MPRSQKLVRFFKVHIIAATPNATNDPATAKLALRTPSALEALEAEGLGLVVDDTVEVDIVDEDAMPSISAVQRKNQNIDLLIEIDGYAPEDAAPLVPELPFPGVLPVSPLPLLPTGD